MTHIKMIVGNGLIGKKLTSIDRDNIVFFASGVSDSKANIESNFLREENLILDHRIYKDKLFVYFSTCSIYDNSLQDMPYIVHKCHMEDIIKTNFPRYLIIRTTNIVGRGGNPSTIMNHIYNGIINNSTINVWKNAERNILDVDHLIAMVDLCIGLYGLTNETIILANPNNSGIQEIVTEFQSQLNRKVNLDIIDKGTRVLFDKTLSANLFKTLGINYEHYLKTLIRKYYIK